MLLTHPWDKLPYQLKWIMLPNIKILRLMNKLTFNQSVIDWIEYFTYHYNIKDHDIHEYLKYSSTVRLMYDIRLFKVRTLKTVSHGTFYQGTIELTMIDDKLKITFEDHQGYDMDHKSYDGDNFEWFTFNYKCYSKDPSIEYLRKDIRYKSKQYHIFQGFLDSLTRSGRASIYASPKTETYIFYDLMTTYHILRDKIGDYHCKDTDIIFHNSLKQRLLQDLYQFPHYDKDQETLESMINNL